MKYSKKIITKYQSDSFLFLEEASLPSLSDEEWLDALRGSSEATRRRVYASMSKVRAEGIALRLADMPCTSNNLSQEISDQLISPKNYIEYVFPDCENDPLADFRAGAISVPADWSLPDCVTEPFDLRSLEVDEIISRFYCICDALRRAGWPVVDTFYDAKIDPVTKAVLKEALLSHDGKGDDVLSIRHSILAAEKKALDIMQSVLLAIATGRLVSEVRGELEESLGQPLGDVSGVTIDIRDGGMSLRTAQSLLSLVERARENGILDIESDIRNVESLYFAKGMELVTDGFEPAMIQEWAVARQAFLLQNLATRFDIVASGCLSLVRKENPRIGFEMMAAHVDTDVSPGDIHCPAPKLRHSMSDKLPLTDWTEGEVDWASPIGRFRLMMVLQQEMDSEPIIQQEELVASLAMSLPRQTWLDVVSLFHGLDAGEALRQALMLALNRDRAERGPALMNTVKNLGLDTFDQSGIDAKFLPLLERLSHLSYWDVLLLNKQEFDSVVSRLSRKVVTGLKFSNFGVFANGLGFSWPDQSDVQHHGDSCRYALLCALASRIAGEELKEMPLSVPTSIGGYDLAKLVEKHPLESGRITQYAASFLTSDKQSLEEKIAVFQRLPHELLELVVLSVNENGDNPEPFELEEYPKPYDTLISSLRRDDRMRLKKSLVRKTTIHEDILAALDFGFDELCDLSDKDIRELLKNVGIEDLTLSLATASQAVQDKFFDNLTERTKEMLLEDFVQVRHSITDGQVVIARRSMTNVAVKLGMHMHQRPNEKSLMNGIVSFFSN